MTETQALLHADLHTGSVMCSPVAGQTFVIDPEFAFYGPIGFDIGAIIANFFLNYVSQHGHKNGDMYANWVLDQAVIVWKTFEVTFCQLWDESVHHTGDAYHRCMLATREELDAAQKSFLAQVFDDSIGFAGMKMLRRIVGIAHVEDLESIEDPDTKSVCERHGLEVAKELIKNSSLYGSMESVISMVASKK